MMKAKTKSIIPTKDRRSILGKITPHDIAAGKDISTAVIAQGDPSL